MTETDDRRAPDRPSRWDLLAAELVRRREQVGDPSFTEIARQVSLLRAADGRDEHAARVARSTVYDVFRPGRSRINLELARDVLVVLGGRREDLDALLDGATPATAATDPASEPEPPVRVEPTRIELTVVPGRTSPAAAWTSATTFPSRRGAWRLVAACVLLGLAGRMLVNVFSLPFHLDMTGTALAATALGPWWGAAAGLGTSLLGSLDPASGWDSPAFIPVQVVGALVWGYGVHRLGAGRSIPRFFSCSVTAGVLCSLVAVPIAVALDGTSNASRTIAASIADLLHSDLAGLAVANLLVSLVDKNLSGFLALALVAVLPLAYRRAVPLVFTRPAEPSSGRHLA